MKDLFQNHGYSNVDVDVFTYAEMRLATKLFRPDQTLGEGGFGIVYKGVIDENVKPGYKTTEVAIKELNPEGFQGDREWLVFSGLTLLSLLIYFLPKCGFIAILLIYMIREAFVYFLCRVYVTIPFTEKIVK